MGFGGTDGVSWHNLQNEVEADVVIIDEFSMVDVNVMCNLMQSVDVRTRLVFVGDKDQLPSVGPGNVMADMLKTKQIPTIQLSQIFRQAQESMIIVNAHKINNGEMLEKRQEKNDFFILPADRDIMSSVVCSLVSERLPAYLGVAPTKIQVLAPIKNGEAGVENLNLQLQKILNPPQPSSEEIVYGERVFRKGDKVMQTSNNYNQEWIKLDSDGRRSEGKGVFNGDMGFVEDVSKITNELVVRFEDGRQCRYTSSELSELVLSYAITIHKSQGSEFDAVVIPIGTGNPEMFTRNLLYTAVTRAKKLVVLVGDHNKIFGIIRNTNARKRETLLPYYITGEINQIEQGITESQQMIAEEQNSPQKNPLLNGFFYPEDQVTLFDDDDK